MCIGNVRGGLRPPSHCTNLAISAKAVFKYLHAFHSAVHLSRRPSLKFVLFYIVDNTRIASFIPSVPQMLKAVMAFQGYGAPKLASLMSTQSTQRYPVCCFVLFHGVHMCSPANPTHSTTQVMNCHVFSRTAHLCSLRSVSNRACTLA